VPSEFLAELRPGLPALEPGERWAVYYTEEAIDQVHAGSQVNPKRHNSVIRGSAPEAMGPIYLVGEPGPHEGTLLYFGGWLDIDRGLVLAR
jgi:hypothetical protein